AYPLVGWTRAFSWARPVRSSARRLRSPASAELSAAQFWGTSILRVLVVSAFLEGCCGEACDSAGENVTATKDGFESRWGHQRQWATGGPQGAPVDRGWGRESSDDHYRSRVLRVRSVRDRQRLLHVV